MFIKLIKLLNLKIQMTETPILYRPLTDESSKHQLLSFLEEDSKRCYCIIGKDQYKSKKLILETVQQHVNLHKELDYGIQITDGFWNAADEYIEVISDIFIYYKNAKEDNFRYFVIVPSEPFFYLKFTDIQREIFKENFHIIDLNSIE